MAERNDATYVYAVTRGLSPSELHGVAGVGDRPVRLVDHVGLAAVVSTVDLDEFGEEALHSNLEDLSWLEATARAHHAVVEAAGAAAPAAPLRLATVYHSDERVRDLLDEWHEAFAQALSRVEGRTEWGVKAYADPDAFAETPSGSGPAPSPTASRTARSGSGTAYLQRRRSAHRSREEAGRAATERGEDIHAALHEVAADSRRHPPQDQRLTGHTGWMVLNGAYLVDDDHVGDLRAIVADFETHPGLELELTGPWVPYSFADLDLER